MPAWMVGAEARHVTRYDVCAIYGELPRFLAHAILCDEDKDRVIDADNAQVRAIQMGPPLRRSVTRADVVGSASLSDSEKRQIKSFVDDRLLERKAYLARLKTLGDRWDSAGEYIICPEAQPPDRDFPLWRFSCAGFVIHAYAEAGLTLLSNELPHVSLENVTQAYSWAQQQLNDPVFRTQMGIGTGDSWPIVFVGYVIHSLSRDHHEIRTQPYRPISGDQFYPAEPKPSHSEADSELQ